MQSGLFLILPRPDGRSVAQVLREGIEDAILAESLGFDRVWLTEHHGTDYGTCWSPSVVGAAIALRTTRIGIGYAVNVAPFHGARRLAEDLATVDHLSSGRVVAGFGSGYSPLEYGVMDADFEHRGEASRQTIDRVLQFWTDASPTGVPCFQTPHPPVVVACRSEQAIRSVAKAGHGILLLGGLERIAAGAAAYRGVAGPAGYVGAMRHVCIPPAGQDSRVLHAATEWTLDRMRHLAGDDSSLRASDLEEYLQERASIGLDPLRQDLERLDEAGVDEILCWMRWGDLPTQLVHHSMRAFASQLLHPERVSSD